MRTRTSEHPTLIAVALAGTMLAAAPSNASYLWEPRVQITDTVTNANFGVEGAYLKVMQFGRGETESVFLHHVIHEFHPEGSQGPGWAGRGVYLYVDNNFDYDAARENAEQFTTNPVFTPGFPPPSGTWRPFVSDFRMVVDRNDDVHVVYEQLALQGTNLAFIAYKRRGASNWLEPADPGPPPTFNDPFEVTPSAMGSCGCISPRMTLQETVAGDILHVVFSYGPGSNPPPQCAPYAGWLGYSRKGLWEPDDAWHDVSFVTNRGGVGLEQQKGPVADASGKVHFFIGEGFDNGAGERIVHMAGIYPGPGQEWTFADADIDTLDEFTVPVQFRETNEGPETDSNLGTNGLIHFTWTRFENDVRETRFATYDPLTDAWYPPHNIPPEDSRGVPISPIDGSTSARPFLATAGATAHVIYHEPGAGSFDNDPTARLYHVFNADPTNENGWSARTEAAVDRRTGAIRPPFVAKADTVWLAYNAREDDIEGQDQMDWEAYFKRGYSIPDVALPGASNTWSGSVFLDADFVVPVGETLVIEPGTEVFAAADRDRNNQGAYPNLVEIVVEGTIEVNGEAGSEVIFSTYDPDLPSEEYEPQPGDWGGIRLELASCSDASYGYIGSIMRPSNISHALMEHAERAITIAGSAAPSITDVTFATNANNHDIYLDQTDVFIPYGYCSEAPGGQFIVDPAEWRLEAPTRVQASNTSLSDDPWYGMGTAAKVDLFVQGKLFTDNAQGPGAVVSFGPEDLTSATATGDGWGGITLDYLSKGSILEDADIGYAENPLFLYYPDELTTVRNSKIHHFADTGVWIYGSVGTGAIVEGSTIERGADLEEVLGTVGLFLDKADEVDVLNNWVLLGAPDLANSFGGTGIHVLYGASFCQSAPPDPQSLLIQDNFVMGPGEDVGTGNDYSGIKLEWICAASNRTVEVKENFIEQWEFAALHFDRAVDVQVNCNKAVGCARDVEVYQDIGLTGLPVRFWENNWNVLTENALYRVFRTNNLLRNDLGPAVTNSTGDNRLAVHPANQATKFIVETDPLFTPGVPLDATQNYWYTDNGTTRTLLNTPNPIKNRITQSPLGSVDYSSFRTVDASHTCPLPTRPPGAPTGTSAALAEAELRGGEGAASAGDELPTRVSFEGPAPNPARSGSEFVLAVPSDRTGEYELEVFDVRGRRVFASVREVTAPGRYPLAWSGKDSEGSRVGAGTYFLRVRGPGFTQTRRVTIVR